MGGQFLSALLPTETWNLTPRPAPAARISITDAVSTASHTWVTARASFDPQLVLCAAARRVLPQTKTAPVAPHSRPSSGSHSPSPSPRSGQRPITVRIAPLLPPSLRPPRLHTLPTSCFPDPVQVCVPRPPVTDSFPGHPISDLHHPQHAAASPPLHLSSWDRHIARRHARYLILLHGQESFVRVTPLLCALLCPLPRGHSARHPGDSSPVPSQCYNSTASLPGLHVPPLPLISCPTLSNLSVPQFPPP